MKKNLIVIFLLISLKAFSQQELPVDSASHRISFSEVVSASKATKQQLYPKAKEWFVKTFNSGKDVIQLDDPINGKIIGRGFSTFERTFNGIKISNELWYLITIMVKEGRYKYIITDMTISTKIEDGDAEKKPLEENIDARKKIAEKSEVAKTMLEKDITDIKTTINSITTSIKASMVAKDDF